MGSIEIPFVNLATPARRRLKEAILREMGKIADRADFILGSKVAEFEARFADKVGGRYAVGVNSGLDALMLSLRAAGVGPGDEVVTTPFSFVATAAAIALVGAKAVFADVRGDANWDPDRARKAVNPRTKAILPVHWAGIPCEVPRIPGVAVIVDAAQAVGAKWDLGRADFVCYSLHPLKNLGVWGDGGMVVVHDECRRDALRLQRNHGLRNRDETLFFSYNSRLDTIQAVAGLACLELVEDIVDRRRAIARRYNDRLSGIAEIPHHDHLTDSAVHLYQIHVSRRDELRRHLESRGVETKVHYPIPLHLQPAARSWGYGAGDFPEAERIAAQTLSLPVREDLTDEQVDRVIRAVLEFL